MDYHWRVDSKNSAGVTQGDEWIFTTIAAPAGSGSSGGGGGGKCGLMGPEALIIFGLLWLIRKRKYLLR